MPRSTRKPSRRRAAPLFLLGADPEFVCYRGDVRDKATGRILKPGGMIRAAETRFANEEDELGGDHSGRPFEVRPEPEECPLELVSNIRSILTSHTLRNPGFYEYTWKAGSFHVTPHGRATPIGGHIHVGGLEEIAPAAAVDLLDATVGVATLLLEDTQEGIDRRAAGYGCTDHMDNRLRVQDYGFEYRTPSSWLTSPQVAAGVLCMTKAVLTQAISAKGAMRQMARTLQKPHPDHVRKMEQEEMRNRLWPHVWEVITKSSLYAGPYQPHLNFIAHLIKHKRTWYPKRSMKEAWGVPNPAFIRPPNGHRLPLLSLDGVWAKVGQVVVKAPPVARSAVKPVDKAPQGVSTDSGKVGMFPLPVPFPAHL